MKNFYTHRNLLYIRFAGTFERGIGMIRARQKQRIVRRTVTKRLDKAGTIVSLIRKQHTARELLEKYPLKTIISAMGEYGIKTEKIADYFEKSNISLFPDKIAKVLQGK